MAPFVIDLRTAEDTRDVVHRAVQALFEGKLVAFPTETVYGLAASARNAAAVERLLAVKGSQRKGPFALAVKSADEALDYVPRLSPLGWRLARRCWPGPVTIVAPDHDPDSLVTRLPRSVQQAVVPGDTIGLRVPAHAMIVDVLRMLAGPLILTSANRSGTPDTTTAQEVVERLGEEIDLVLDDGPTRYGQPSSVVKVAGKELEVLREGVVSARTLKRLASYMIVMVCTGNTCRSPMAEVLLRDLIASRLGCKAGELDDRGIVVASAGIAAMAGGRPSAEAVEVLKEQGLNLEDHESQPLTEQLVRQADLILTMTRSHRNAIVAQWPDAADRVQLLCRDESDVTDPIGGPVEVYRRCADQIRAELEQRLDELDIL